VPAHPLHDLPAGPATPDEITVFVEIPRGSRNKYEFDEEAGLLRLDRLLYSAVHYPGDYGFIPRTLAGDGDPLDALVLVTDPTFPGCLIDARPLGVFHMEDEKGVDEKILAVPMANPRYEEMEDLDDLAPHLLREIEHFFSVYKDLEGKTTTIGGWHDAKRARQVIEGAIAHYGERRKEGGGTT